MAAGQTCRYFQTAQSGRSSQIRSELWGRTGARPIFVRFTGRVHPWRDLVETATGGRLLPEMLPQSKPIRRVLCPGPEIQEPSSANHWKRYALHDRTPPGIDCGLPPRTPSPQLAPTEPPSGVRRRAGGVGFCTLIQFRFEPIQRFPVPGPARLVVRFAERRLGRADACRDGAAEPSAPVPPMVSVASGFVFTRQSRRPP